jgi:hypothetical protein
MTKVKELEQEREKMLNEKIVSFVSSLCKKMSNTQRITLQRDILKLNDKKND